MEDNRYASEREEISSGEDAFQYRYSASEREEIRRIRDKYSASDKTNDKLDRLRKLDEGVTTKPTVVSLIIGIVSTLVFGIGMCSVLVFDKAWFIPGIFIGLAGIVGLCLAYPAYNAILAREKKRVTGEILSLTDELMQNKNDLG